MGLAAETDPQVHKNSLVRSFEESLQWWLVTRPEVCLRPVVVPHQYLVQCYLLYLCGHGGELIARLAGCEACGDGPPHKESFDKKCTHLRMILAYSSIQSEVAQELQVVTSLSKQELAACC